MIGMPGITGGVGAGGGIQQPQAFGTLPGGMGQPTAQTPVMRQGMMPPMSMQATFPRGFSMVPGQTMWGNVVGQQGNLFTLQFGQFFLTAQTSLPLSMGQRIQVLFNGQTTGNQFHLQLLKSVTMSRMSQSDLSQALTKMNLPVNEKTMNIAQGMVECRIPLTAKNVTEFTRVLSSLPQPMTGNDMMSAAFLKIANVPLTTSNVMVMSNFIAQHPMLGAQLMELYNQPGGHVKTSREQVNREIEIMGELKGLVSRYVIDPKTQNRQQMSRKLKNLAREEGIERLHYGGFGAHTEDGWELMKLLREVEGVPGENLENAGVSEKTQKLLKEVELNLHAHNIINKGQPLPEQAFYYLQAPLKLNGETATAEVRVQYHEEGNRKVIDPENTRIEFDVNTEYLGEIRIDLRVSNGLVSMDIGTRKDDLEEFIERFIPTLRRNLQDIGYNAGQIHVGFFEDVEHPGLIRKEEFENMEKIDVHA